MKSLILSSVYILLIVGCTGHINTNSTVATNKAKDLYSYMWNINPNSFYHQKGYASAGSDINIANVWRRTDGREVKVAVIDDCFDVNHPDLYNNIIDTYNVNTHLKDIQHGDDCHGTKVAGVIASLNDNHGIVGISPKVKLILISFDLEHSTEEQIISAFDYAKSRGAQVINCSWGSNDEGQVLKYKLAELKNDNIIVVFASGNGDDYGNAVNLDNSGYNDESEDPSVIGVGATSENNDVTYYSNYGSNIDILAPGGETVGIYTTTDNNNYELVFGTSFAAPTITGAIALKLSLYPNLSFNQIYNSLVKSADKVGQQYGAYYVNGFDIRRAYGKINVEKFINN